MLKQRVITALLLLPVIFLLLFKVKLEFFSALIIVVIYLMALEWAKLSGINKSIYCSFFALTISFVNIAIWFFSERIDVWPSLSWPHHFKSDLPLVFLLLSVPAVIVAVAIVLSFSRNNQWWQNRFVKGVLAFILLPALYVSLVSVRGQGYLEGDFYLGSKLVLFMLLMIWAADIGAFVTGKLFGKHKLTKVSPNKTWEGVIGGLFFTCMVGWGGVSVLGFNISNAFEYVGVILLLGIISVFGDLFESALKRVANIKDSGNLLPGHGGLLDRLDSTITVAPIFYLSFSYLEFFNV